MHLKQYIIQNVYLRFHVNAFDFIYVLPLQQKLRMVPANSDLSMNSDSSPHHALSRYVLFCNILIALIFEHSHY